MRVSMEEGDWYDFVKSLPYSTIPNQIDAVAVIEYLIGAGWTPPAGVTILENGEIVDGSGRKSQEDYRSEYETRPGSWKEPDDR